MISDEAVEAAARAWIRSICMTEAGSSEPPTETEKRAIRAALEAALPHLLASQGSGQRGCGSRDEPAVGATAALASDWVKWNGGPSLPVCGHDIVDIRLGASEYEGTPEREIYGVRAGDWGWDWRLTDPDIIAWRFSPDTPPDGGEAVHARPLSAASAEPNPTKEA